VGLSGIDGFGIDGGTGGGNVEAVWKEGAKRFDAELVLYTEACCVWADSGTEDPKALAREEELAFVRGGRLGSKVP